MTISAIIRVVQEGLLLVLILSGGPMLVSLVVGLVMSIIQATTQLQEQSLSYVPKLIAIFLTLALTGPWMLAQMLQFTRVLFDSIAGIH
jgi:flagellar biosynthetic protein FliQ